MRSGPVERALTASSLSQPALVIATPNGAPHVVLGDSAYRQRRLGVLTTALRKLGMAALKSASPRWHTAIDSLLFVVDGAGTVKEVLEDGRLKGAEFVDLAKLGIGGAVRVRDVTAPEPTVVHGPDDGLRAPPQRPRDVLDTGTDVIGLIAKGKGVYESAVVPAPFDVEADPFREAAKMWGQVNPLAGAAVTVLGALFDDRLHRSLGLGPSELFGAPDASATVATREAFGQFHSAQTLYSPQ